MKKTFSARHNAFLLPRSVSRGIFVLIFVFLFLLLRLLAPNTFWKILTPFFSVSDSLAKQSHVFFAHFANASKLVVLNEKLQEENATLAIENKILTQKVTNLSLLFSSSVTKSIPGIQVSVIARPPESPYDTLLLAGGRNNGIALGNEVFAKSGMPIGSITSVLDEFSQATLFSASGVLTYGWVGRTAIPITIIGTGGGTLSATLARTAPVVVGDTVFVPGPGMLPVGSVVRIDSDPLSPGITLRIMPAHNLFSTSEVVVRAVSVAPSIFATSTAP